MRRRVNSKRQRGRAGMLLSSRRLSVSVVARCGLEAAGAIYMALGWDARAARRGEGEGNATAAEPVGRGWITALRGVC